MRWPHIRFTKLCLIIRYPCFSLLKLITFKCGFSTKVSSAFLVSETFVKLSELNNFQAKITMLSSTLFIRGFKGHNLFWDLPFWNEKFNKNKLVYQNLSYHVKKTGYHTKKLVITLKNWLSH